MSSQARATNNVRSRRTRLGWTQAELADRAGISRTAVTAIEGERLIPSVSAALSLAQALQTSVEELFGSSAALRSPEVWAWPPALAAPRCWRAEVNGRIIVYPASTSPMLAMLPDQSPAGLATTAAVETADSLVMATCDPAAGLLAARFREATGLRLLVLPRSSRQALQLLKEGLVHLAGIHFETKATPEHNVAVARRELGCGQQLLRLAHWQEGITAHASVRLRSVRAALDPKITWVGREPGSGARQCLDQLLDGRPGPRRVAGNHQGVVEAVRSGWADAGICVQLASVEAGLKFLPVQQEAYDLCFADWFAEDRRMKAFFTFIRSAAYADVLRDLPGYDSIEAGQLRAV